MLTSSSHQHEGFVNFIPAGGLRQFHTGMRASPMCVQRLADSVRSRLMCCHGMWKHVDAGSCPSRGPITHQMAHVRLFGRVPPRRRCNTVWEATPRSRASTCQRPRSSVRSICVCVCVFGACTGRRCDRETGANQALSRLCERGRFPQDVLRPRPCRPGPRRR